MFNYLTDNIFTRFLDSILTRFRPRSSGTQYRTVWQILHLDVALLLGLLGVMVFGFFILYSASNGQPNMVSQGVFRYGFAFLLMFIVAQVSPSFYQRWSPWFYLTVLIMLFAVLLMGHINKGAQRWLSLGVLKFQPSELMKLAIPMMLSWYYSRRPLPPDFKDLLFSGAIILIPAVLIAKQPDLGTALMIIIGGVFLLLLAGLRWRWFIGLLLCAAIITPIGWHFLHDYQQQRILTFLNPERDPLGAGYHIIQSKIAIGSGGFLGKGFLQGSQSHLHFLPENTTDFIFSVCGEDFGLLGSGLLLLLYLAMTLRCLFIAYSGQDTYTRLLAGSLTMMFFMSVFVNIGMVSGLLPVVGLPLPLISYGGSSMLTLMVSFGLLMSIHGHRYLIET